MRFYSALIFMALMSAATTAPAQAVPSAPDDLGPTISKSHPIAISIGYLAMIGNAPPGTCGCFLLNGGSGEALIHVWKNVAAVADVSGNRTSLVPQSQQGLSLVTYMGGPRYSFHPARRFTLYGQFLVGGAHGFDSYFPRNDGQPTGAANSLAYAPGGGIEIGIKDWLSWQAVKGEYVATRLPNDFSEHQNNLRLGSGVVIRFSTQRLNR
jgi:outer membrane immunogenic protein